VSAAAAFSKAKKFVSNRSRENSGYKPMKDVNTYRRPSGSGYTDRILNGINVNPPITRPPPQRPNDNFYDFSSIRLDPYPTKAPLWPGNKQLEYSSFITRRGGSNIRDGPPPNIPPGRNSIRSSSSKPSYTEVQQGSRPTGNGSIIEQTKWADNPLFGTKIGNSGGIYGSLSKQENGTYQNPFFVKDSNTPTISQTSKSYGRGQRPEGAGPRPSRPAPLPPVNPPANKASGYTNFLQKQREGLKTTGSVPGTSGSTTAAGFKSDPATRADMTIREAIAKTKLE
jgi:hypothetical protein